MDARGPSGVTEKALGQIGLTSRPTAALTCGNSLHCVEAKLFVGHGEDAVPIGGRFVEEVVLAAFPVGAGGSVVRPLIEDGLKGGLGIKPFALLIESAGLEETIKASLRVRGESFAQAKQFVDDHGFKFAFDTNEIEFAKNEI